jgi:hypothetical protein
MNRFVMTLTMCGVVLAMGMPAPGEDLVDIDIKLPKRTFGGTPLDYMGENLEERVYTLRPPFKAPAGTTNVALGKTVTSSAEATIFGDLSQLTDGNKEAEDTSLVDIEGPVQWVQVDLGKNYAIYAIVLWHFHLEERLFFDVVIRVSDDPEFKEGVTTLFNNDHNNTSGLGVGKDKEYIETYEGKLIGAKGATGRYVRFYSNGNTETDTNQYLEIEVYGKLLDQPEMVEIDIALPKPSFG